VLDCSAFSGLDIIRRGREEGKGEEWGHGFLALYRNTSPRGANRSCLHLHGHTPINFSEIRNLRWAIVMVLEYLVLPEACLASTSAFSLPGVPWWPLIHTRSTALPWLRSSLTMFLTFRAVAWLGPAPVWLVLAIALVESEWNPSGRSYSDYPGFAIRTI
jgi:hypothetical protein